MIGVILDFPGGTLEQHDEAVKRMGFEPGGPAQPDCLFHWVAKTDTGIRVVDVWTSRDAFDRALNQDFGPPANDLQMPDPEISSYDVHAYLRSPISDG